MEQRCGQTREQRIKKERKSADVQEKRLFQSGDIGHDLVVVVSICLNVQIKGKNHEKGL